MINAIALSSLLAALFAPLPAPAGPAPIAVSAVIDVQTVNGSGCPAGAAAVSISPSGNSFTLTYSGYTARSGGSAAITDRRKNCQVSVHIAGPAGWTYAVSRADYQGSARLGAGVSATQSASYYFQGSPDTTTTSHPVTSGRWHTVDTFADDSLVYAPCDQDVSLEINTSVVLSGTGSGSVTLDRSGVYGLVWAPCPA